MGLRVGVEGVVLDIVFYSNIGILVSRVVDHRVFVLQLLLVQVDVRVVYLDGVLLNLRRLLAAQ